MMETVQTPEEIDSVHDSQFGGVEGVQNWFAYSKLVEEVVQRQTGGLQFQVVGQSGNVKLGSQIDSHEIVGL